MLKPTFSVALTDEQKKSLAKIANSFGLIHTRGKGKGAQGSIRLLMIAIANGELEVIKPNENIV